MQTTKHPYEFLARWDQNGALKGAQIQWRYVITDNGTVIDGGISNAEPVNVAGNDGFPVSEILEDVQKSAVVAMNTAIAEKSVTQTNLDAALARIVELEAALSECEQGNT